MNGAALQSHQRLDDRAARRRFEEIYADCHAAVLGYVLRRTGNREDAADVIAETFLAAWRRVEELPAGDAARLWLYGTARRALANHRRGQRRRVALTDRLSEALQALPSTPQPAAEDCDFAAVFGSLPAADRELLALSAWEGLEPAEIAVVLGCSRNAARIRLHRARRRLAERLGRDAKAPRTHVNATLEGESS